MEHDTSFLLQAFVFLAAAIISVPIARRLGLGAVLGYLIAGAAIGPYGFKFLGDPESVMGAAELGVVIMLFLIGLELAPALLWRMRAAILGLGGLQVAATGAAIAGVAFALGIEWRVAIAVGLTLALSSTAIVLQSLREKGLDSATSGRDAFVVLLFQDIAVIPMLALFPLLAAAPTASEHAGPLADMPAWSRPLLVLSAVALVILAGRFLMRPLFRIIASTGLQEVFTATALALVVGVALLMQTVGLSPALGAFLAGVVLADSEYRHEVESDIEPFRALLLGLFFITVGASVNFALVTAQPLLILAIVAALIAVKAAMLFIVARIMKRPRADAALIALALAQGGEFAFVLFAFAQEMHVIPAETAAPLIAAVAVSMALTPFLIIAGERLSSMLARPDEERAAPEDLPIGRPVAIIAGFGRFGQIVHRLLIANGFQTSILEHDSEQVEIVRTFRHKANYGDAARIDLLRAAGAADAKLLVVAIDNSEKASQIAENARRNFPHLKVLVRAYDRQHAFQLMRIGVDGFERETFESALRLGATALRLLGRRAHAAERAAGVFRRHDLRQLNEMAEHWRDDDFDAYRSVALARQDMVEEALRRDLAAHGAIAPGAAWEAERSDEENAA